MTGSELDTVYTTLCNTLMQIGEENSHVYLARLTLLCFAAVSDSTKCLELIRQAAADI